MMEPESKPSIDELTARSSTRYLLAGVLTFVVLSVICISAAILIGTGFSPLPQPTPTARLRAQLDEQPSKVAPGAAFTVRGRGFLPGEKVDIFITTSTNAPFSEFINLGSATANSSGVIELQTAAPSEARDYYLIARGSSTGFTRYTRLIVDPSATATLPEPPTAAPVTPVPLPELHITSVSIGLQQDTSCLLANTPFELGLRVTIQNRGSVFASPFVVQANDQQALLPRGLAPGESTTLWFPGYLTGNNRVIVDPGNAIAKAASSSLVFEGPLVVPTLPPPCTPVATQPVPQETPTPDPNAPGVWFGQFFPNQDLLGTPQFTLSRNDLNINWGSNSPGGNIPRNNWSAIFTRNENFPTTDNYQFTLVVDGGARVYLDGNLIIDEWRFGGLRTVTANRGLVAGPHTLRVEYFKATQTARLSLSWRVNYSGWVARYYNSTNRDGPLVIKRDDPEINFNWGLGSPAPEVNNDLFSVSWQRQLSLPPGEYLFEFDLTDGVRFYLDNQLVIDSYNVQGPRVLTATRSLAGSNHFFEVQYAHFFGPARIRFRFALLPPTPTPTVPTPTPSPTVPSPTPTPTVPTPTPSPTVPTPTSTPTVPPPTATETLTPEAETATPTSATTLTVVVSP